MTGRLTATVVVALAMGAGIAAGCSAPRADRSACARIDDEVLVAIGERLDVEGELRHGQVVPSERPGVRFVSAELHDPGAEDDAKGDIYTWAMTGDGGGSFLAVDTRAKRDSSWPAAAYDVRESGAIESRACTKDQRGRDPDRGGECPPGTAQQFCDRAAR